MSDLPKPGPYRGSRLEKRARTELKRVFTRGTNLGHLHSKGFHLLLEAMDARVNWAGEQRPASGNTAMLKHLARYRSTTCKGRDSCRALDAQLGLPLTAIGHARNRQI